MRQFMAFVRKEFFHIMRDKRTILILLGIPVIQIILFGFAIATEIKNCTFAVVNHSNDFSALEIIQRLHTSEYFEFGGYVAGEDAIERVFRKDEADLVIVFEDSFSSKLYHDGNASVQLIADASDPNKAVSLVNYARAIIISHQRELQGGSPAPYRILSNVRLLYNPQMKDSYNFVPGVMGMILMLICAMMTSVAIVREKETGTMEVLLVSPVRPVFIILAKAVPYFVISCVNLATILLLAVNVLGVPLGSGIFPLAVISLIFIFVSLSLGLFVSAITERQSAAMLVSGMALIMPVVILSGMMFPVENMPLFLRWISRIIPARWYIAAVRKLMIKGLGISSVMNEIMILALMAFVLITVSLKKFKKRLE